MTMTYETASSTPTDLPESDLFLRLQAALALDNAGPLDEEEVRVLQADYQRLAREAINLRRKNLERRKALRALNRAMAASKWQLDCMRQNYLRVANELARVEARNRGS